MIKYSGTLNALIMEIYVGNLDFKVNDSDLEEAFKEYGTVNNSKVVTDKYSGRSRGFGFVSMEDDEDAKKAIKELNGATFGDREIVVNEAKPRKI
jgi:RNA recognition motif-containing protein